MVDAAAELIFDASIGDRYDLALASLGVAPELLWMNPVSE